MTTTTLIFRLSSICFFSFGVGFLTSERHYRQYMLRYLSDASLLFFGGLANIVIGCVLLQFLDTHPDPSPRLLMVLAWGAVAKGVGFLALPAFYPKLKGLFKAPFFPYAYAVLLFAMGAGFGYYGFMV